MFMSLINRRHQKGIGLLELMLSLAIIAILLIMATRYYQSASDQNKRNQAVDMFAAVNGAVEAYKIDNSLSTPPTITSLASDGYLPPSYSASSTANPWGGEIKITITPASGSFTVEMDDVPAGSCQAVGTRVNSTIAQTGATDAASCPKDGTTVTATYNL